MLAAHFVLIVFHSLMTLAMYFYWSRLRDSASVQNEFWRQRSAAFLKFQVYLLPFAIIIFVFQIVNSCFDIYLLLR